MLCRTVITVGVQGGTKIRATRGRDQGGSQGGSKGYKGWGSRRRSRRVLKGPWESRGRSGSSKGSREDPGQIQGRSVRSRGVWTRG